MTTELTIECPHCSSLLQTPEPRPWGRCGTCLAMVFPPQEGPRVVVAHGSEEASEEIGRVLSAEGIWTIHVNNGQKLLDYLGRVGAEVALLDVGIADPNAYEIIALIRSAAATQGLKIILLASVFNRTAYKRKPTSLYGADDYIEQHRISELLPEKLATLLASRVATEGGES